MKTAKEWVARLAESNLSYESSLALVKEIQLDAWRAGMIYAAGIAKRLPQCRGTRISVEIIVEQDYKQNLL